MPGGSDTWSFHTNKRYLCPVCNRRGLIERSYNERGRGWVYSWTCMYRSGYKKDCESPFLFDKLDPIVLKANPDIAV